MSTSHYNTINVEGRPEAMPSALRLAGIWNATANQVDELVTINTEGSRPDFEIPGWDRDADAAPLQIIVSAWASHEYAGAHEFALRVTREYDVTVSVGYDCPDESDRSDDAYSGGAHILHNGRTLLSTRQILRAASTIIFPNDPAHLAQVLDTLAERIDSGELNTTAAIFQEEN